MNPFCIERQLSIGHRARELQAKRSAGHYRPPMATCGLNAKTTREVERDRQLAGAREAREFTARSAEFRWIMHSLRTDAPEDLPQTKAALGLGPGPDPKKPK